ncbi:hypothetical protein [Paenibacillus harenae]|uniref:hypothetical protein n=1 Tax=Paenibacillus harenae TaxID=306543 RepID=UPI0027D76C59|nr:hypothetical protein [Paenibacillus harenae]
MFGKSIPKENLDYISIPLHKSDGKTVIGEFRLGTIGCLVVELTGSLVKEASQSEETLMDINPKIGYNYSGLVIKEIKR